MPWSAADASRFKKGLSPAQRKKWAQVANHVLASTGSDAEAVRTANARTGRKKRATAASRKR